MKKLFVFLFILFTAQLLFIGCDSPSGSKPDVVSKPVLVAPEDKTTNVPLTPQFKWTGTADILEIATKPNFSTGDIMHTAAISDQQYNLPSNVLQRGTMYYWRAGKTAGTSVDWSTTIFSFTTIN